MNKIKVIDLLNMISKGEEVPRKIKINNVIYEYIGYMYCTEKANYQDIEDYLFGKWNFNILNEEVEILDEPKEDKIEKLDDNFSYRLKMKDILWNDNEVIIVNKINELIDKMQELQRSDSNEKISKTTR